MKGIDATSMPPVRADGVSQPGSALVIEDHPIYRDALVHLLHSVLDASRTYAAGSLEEGLRIATALADLRLVLLDVGLPGIGGPQAVAAVRRSCPSAVLVVVSASEDRRDVKTAFRAGAHLFVSKAVAASAIQDIVRSVLAGTHVEQQAWISSSGEGDFLAEALPTLTVRQRQILQLLAKGESNKEIGLRLALAEVTVKVHISAIFKILGVANRTQAARAAHQLELTTVVGPTAIPSP
jgi:two-component system nitrate/nitrite response regulator NarL